MGGPLEFVVTVFYCIIEICHNCYKSYFIFATFLLENPSSILLELGAWVGYKSYSELEVFVKNYVLCPWWQQRQK